MKKKLAAVFGVVFSLLIGVFAYGFKPAPAYAEEVGEAPITADTILDETYFGSLELYQAIKAIATEIKIANNIREENTLKAGDLSGVRTLDLTYARMSVEYYDLSAGGYETINLYEDTGEENWINPEFRLTTIAGLDYLYNTSFATIILDNNNIETIEANVIKDMTTLKTLSIKNNKLKSVAIPSSIPLHNLDLSGNKLEEIDLNCLRMVGTEVAECHLENNNFSDASKIILPDLSDAANSNKKANVYLSQNYLTDATKADFGGHSVSLLLQGLKQSENPKYTNNTYIRVTSDALAEGFATGEVKLTAKAFFRAGSAYYDAAEENLAAESDAEGKLVLPTGKLVIKFYNDGVEYTNGDFANKNIDVYPNAPVMRVEVDGKLLDENPSKYKGTFKVIAMAPSADASVEIRLGSSEWQNANAWTIKDRGEYIVYARVTVDGLTSESAYLFIENTTSLRMTWTVIIVGGIVILGVGGYFLYNWFRNGAMVAPLSDREIAREQVRRSKKARAEEEKRK